ncbi:Mth938-like domain-containing protein [Ectothiorhodospira lacustris]|uniref:Mth938-like domain-containing protein n=1 Tax=Ectothiorhodospira lacustris TaxID=2899127 RepID=UPI001EE91503|nr:Mth938-like domain-containing protein [Ectothiorhodospira lacustris]MCG5500315.1 Mth938-like domain-containing protein [Ectothiorhodospira lacustris]
MKMTREYGDGRHVITAHDATWIQVNQTRYEKSLVVLPDALIPNWGPTDPETLTAAALAPILERSPEILLLGTGPVMRFPGRDILRLFKDRGIGLEVMDTAAACRTYNVIMNEGRRVAVALMVPGD